MPIPVHLERFECIHCLAQYDTVEEAAKCETSHDLIYIPMTRSDVKRLWSFIVTGRPEYLTSSIEATLRKYNKLRGE